MVGLEITSFLKWVATVDVPTTRIVEKITKKIIFTYKQSLKEFSIGKATNPVIKLIIIWQVG